MLNTSTGLVAQKSLTTGMFATFVQCIYIYIYIYIATFTSITGSITGNTKIGEIGEYTFNNIHPKGHLPVNSILRIQFPAELEVKPNCEITAPNPCTCIFIDKATINITGCLPTNDYFSENSTSISFTIENIYNPSKSVGISNSLIIQSYIPGEAACTHQSAFPMPTTGFTASILTLSISPTTTNILDTIYYTFGIRALSRIEQNSKIYIQFPTGITPSTTCLEVTALSPITCTIHTPPQTIQISGGFPANLTEGTDIAFKVQATNSRIVTTTGTFGVWINTTETTHIYTGGITVDIQKQSIPLIITKASEINAVANKYSFETTLPHSLIISDFINIAIPPEIPSCDITTMGSDHAGIASPRSTTRAANIYTYEINNTVPPGTTKIRMDCTNPTSIQTTSNILISICNGAPPTCTLMMDGSTTTSTTLPSSFEVYTITPNTTYANVPGKYVFRVTRFAPYDLLPFNELKIYPPVGPVITWGSLSCGASVGFTAVGVICAKLPPDDVLVTGTTTQRAMEFSMEGYTNPMTATPTPSFTLETFDSTGRRMERVSTTLTITADCNFPCMSCNLASKSSCTACFPLIYNFPEIYLYTNTKECINSCPLTSMVNSVALTCTDCILPCHTCAGSITHCLTCVPGKLLQGALCVDECYPQYFPDQNGVCQGCHPSCRLCVNTTDSCTHCWDKADMKPHLMYEPDIFCYDSCPVGSYQETINTCVVCPEPCLTCSSRFSCNSCKSGYKLTEDHRCVRDCLPHLFAAQDECVESCRSNEYTETQSDIKSCITCHPHCATCANNSQKCTSCPQDRILSNTSCLTGCRLGTWEDTELRECRKCFFPCLICGDTGSYCISCVTGYSLYNNQCLDKCPKYYNRNMAMECVEEDNVITFAPIVFIAAQVLIIGLGVIGKLLVHNYNILDSLIWQSQTLQFIAIGYEGAVLVFQEASLEAAGTTIFVLYFLTWTGLILGNTAFATLYIKLIQKDFNFGFWAGSNPGKFKAMIGLMFGTTFQTSRLHTSTFFRNSKLRVDFSDKSNIQKLITNFSRVSMMAIYTPLICTNLLWIFSNQPDMKLYFFQLQQTALLVTNLGLIAYEEIRRLPSSMKDKPRLEEDSELQLKEVEDTNPAINPDDTNNQPDETGIALEGDKLETLLNENNTSFDVLNIGKPKPISASHRTSKFLTKKSNNYYNIYIYIVKGIKRRPLDNSPRMKNKLAKPAFEELTPRLPSIPHSKIASKSSLLSKPQIHESPSMVSATVSKKSLIVEQLMPDRKMYDHEFGSRDTLRSRPKSHTSRPTSRLEEFSSTGEIEGRKTPLDIIDEVINENTLVPNEAANYFSKVNPKKQFLQKIEELEIQSIRGEEMEETFRPTDVNNEMKDGFKSQDLHSDPDDKNSQNCI